jgi:hypothetical protein
MKHIKIIARRVSRWRSPTGKERVSALVTRVLIACSVLPVQSSSGDQRFGAVDAR